MSRRCSTTYRTTRRTRPFTQEPTGHDLRPRRYTATSPTVPDAGAADDMVDDDEEEEEDMVDAAGYYSSESYDEAWPEPGCVYEDDPPDPAGAQRQAERYAESTRCTTTTRTRATRSSTSSSRPPTATASSSATPTSTSSLGRAAAARSACSSPRCAPSAGEGHHGPDLPPVPRFGGRPRRRPRRRAVGRSCRP